MPVTMPVILDDILSWDKDARNSRTQKNVGIRHVSISIAAIVNIIVCSYELNTYARVDII